MHQTHLECLLKHRWQGPTSSFWFNRWGWEHVFLTCSQLLRLGQAPYLENTCCTTPPHAAAPTGMLFHSLILPGDPILSADTTDTELSPHVRLFYPIKLRPGLHALLPHILGTNLQLSTGWRVCPFFPSNIQSPPESRSLQKSPWAAQREETLFNPQPAVFSSAPLPRATHSSSRGLRQWFPILSSPLRSLTLCLCFHASVRRLFSTKLHLQCHCSTFLKLIRDKPELCHQLMITSIPQWGDRILA